MSPPELVFVPAKPSDALDITLRPSDLLEVKAWAPGFRPELALRHSISHSTVAYKGLSGDEVVCLGGYTVTEHEVVLWLMCSESIEQHGRALLRMSRKSIRDILANHPGKLVGNYLYLGNPQTKRFVTFLGFRCLPAPGFSQFEFFYFPESLCAFP